MTSEWKKLNEYFQQNAGANVTHDPADPHVFEDPRDKSNIFSINLLMRAGIPEQKLRDTVAKIQDILDKNGIAGIVSSVEGTAHHKGIRILAEQPLPKTLGIRSEFDGVPVGFTLVEDIGKFKQSFGTSKKPPAP